MLQVGITGGIGSGKSVVAKVFSLLGVPVLDADATAKKIMNENTQIRQAITQQFGIDAYANGKLNRPFIASAIFNDDTLLAQLNNIVHPAVIEYTKEWSAQQTAPYIIKEAALLFESGSYKSLHKIIGVSSPEELRIKRVLKRDNITEADVRKRINKQMNETEKLNRCDYIIRNDDTVSIIKQVLDLHVTLTELSSKK